ncbi:MAG TPA: 2TM domain-containing protein [Bacteroidales bacterium]|nr:2TM domain-containing protein [Bacteroidales bacterium]HPS16086.1 2TM domain-containing protein [Bacteroidales bacterium]
MEQSIKDPEKWKIAEKRAGFKMHFYYYLIVIAFLWLVWAFIGYIYNWQYSHMWPIYPMIGWGLCLILHFLFVYKWKSRIVSKEYKKLTKQK